MDSPEGHEHEAPRARPATFTVLALLGIIAVSLFVHLHGLSHDLPAPGADEPYFVLPAARMAWKGDANPQWFGHPGSTVIYPLAVAYRAREVLFHGAPLIGEAPSVAARFRSDPTSFYEMGRLWVMLLSVATVPLLFLLARRAFDDVTALGAAFCWALVPLAVSYGSIVRTDAAGACFGLLSLWLCLVALDDPRPRNFAFAGAAIGLAVASRYFMVSLVPVLVAVWWIARSRDRVRVTPRTLVIGLGAAFGLFVLTTPFFFIDWHAVSRSLEAETVGTVTNDRSGWIENLGYYFGQAIPDSVSWLAPILAVAGIVIAGMRRDTRRLLLVGFGFTFLGVISLSSLHWQRWVIQVLPLVVLFAVSAVVWFARAVARSVRKPEVRRWVLVGVVVAGTVAVAAEPAVSLVDDERMQAEPSTRELMRSWIIAHVPVGTPIASEVKGPELRTAGYPTLDRYDLPTDGTLGDYAAYGYHYLIVNAFVALRYRIDAKHFPEHARFYEFLRERGDLLVQFSDTDHTSGPHLKLYYMDPAILAVRHRPRNVAVTSRSRNNRLAHPAPLYPVGEEILGNPPRVSPVRAGG
jgi:hypothetical protein